MLGRRRVVLQVLPVELIATSVRSLVMAYLRLVYARLATVLHAYQLLAVVEGRVTGVRGCWLVCLRDLGQKTDFY